MPGSKSAKTAPRTIDYKADMLRTRADVVVNLAYLFTILAPLVAFFSLRLARRGRQDAHKRVQTLLLTACALAVVALEVRIRLAGGSGALLQGSPYAGSRLLFTAATIHILGAVATYLIWGWLVIISRWRYHKALPGGFSHRHKIAGWLVISGLCFTTLSATAVYFLTFVAS